MCDDCGVFSSMSCRYASVQTTPDSFPFATLPSFCLLLPPSSLLPHTIFRMTLCFCQALYPTSEVYAQCRPGSHPRCTTALADPSSTLASCVVLTRRRACPMFGLSCPCMCSFGHAVPSLQALSLLPLWLQICSPCIVGLCVAHVASLPPRPAAGYDSRRHSLRCALLKRLTLLQCCSQSDNVLPNRAARGNAGLTAV